MQYKNQKVIAPIDEPMDISINDANLIFPSSKIPNVDHSMQQ